MPKLNVTRSIEIQASPEDVFDRIADFGTWTTWSPWLCSEPEAKVTVTENPNSEGSVYTWDGEIVGAGEIEHKTLVRGERIEQELRFLKPWPSKSTVLFDMSPTEGGTKLTWTMLGSIPFFMFFQKSMFEGFIGMDYERGLKMLKDWIEEGHIKSTTNIVGIQPMGPFHVVGVRQQCQLPEISSTMDGAFGEARSKLQQHGIDTNLELISVYHDLSPKTQRVDFTAGFLFGSPIQGPSELSTWSLPAVQALRVDHHGCYGHLGNGWSAANAYARYKKLKQSKVGAFELYKNSPENTAPEHLLTEIYLPLK